MQGSYKRQSTEVNHKEVVMDPVSYLFSAYLNLVQQQVSDIYGSVPVMC